MIRLVPEAWQKLLEPRQNVHFVGRDWPDRFADKFFQVTRTQQIVHSRTFILAPRQDHDFDFSDEDLAGLYPDIKDTLYEILIGVKSSAGSALLYPRTPINEWYITLEKGGWIPDTAVDRKRYIGPYSEEVSPPEKPQIRYHTVKDMDSCGLKLYNDLPTGIDNKIVLDMVINRCRIEEVSRPEVYRDILWYDLLARGAWRG